MSCERGPLWRRDVGRWTDRRAQYVQSAYDIEPQHASTLAYSELGFSSSGIAKRTGFTEATVRGYLDELCERLGETAVYAKPSSQIDVEAAIGGGADLDLELGRCRR